MATLHDDNPIHDYISAIAHMTMGMRSANCKLACKHATAEDMSHHLPVKIVKQPMCVIVLALRDV
jgi:hypothetical protein